MGGGSVAAFRILLACLLRQLDFPSNEGHLESDVECAVPRYVQRMRAEETAAQLAVCSSRDSGAGSQAQQEKPSRGREIDR